MTVGELSLEHRPSIIGGLISSLVTLAIGGVAGYVTFVVNLERDIDGLKKDLTYEVEERRQQDDDRSKDIAYESDQRKQLAADLDNRTRRRDEERKETVEGLRVERQFDADISKEVADLSARLADLVAAFNNHLSQSR